MNIVNKIFKEIKKFKKIIITTHVRADGDCVGSAIGLREIIKETYKDKIVKADHEYLSYLDYLGKPDKVEDDDFKDALVISVDNASLSRANDPRMKECKNIIKIDHHPNREPFGYLSWVEEHRCATAEMIFEMVLRKRGLKISKLGIEALFTGIITDSGRFKYPEVNSNTFVLVGMMYHMGLDGNKIINYLDETTLKELDFKGYVLSNLKMTDHGVLYVNITKEAREKYDIKYDDASNMVGALSNVKGYPIWLLTNEFSDNEIRCRVRSLEIPINKVCEKFGGGGHANASGVIVDTYQKVEELIKELDNLLV